VTQHANAWIAFSIIDSSITNMQLMPEKNWDNGLAFSITNMIDVCKRSNNPTNLHQEQMNETRMKNGLHRLEQGGGW
jgi:hypothetical protein